MRSFKKLNIFLIMVLSIVVLSSCGDDDKITNNEATDFYAELFLTRYYPTQGGLLIITDTISASIDSVYSPQTANKPCCSLNITCNNYTLHWQEGVQRHIFTEDLSELGFLDKGEICIFKVDSGQAVPAFEKSIRFPSVQPILSYPRSYPPPALADSVIISNGFTITWTGTNSEYVELIICTHPELRFQPTDTLYRFITENDGTLNVSPNDLADVTPDALYKILLILKNSESIISEGYDPRSNVTALTYTFSHFYAL